MITVAIKNRLALIIATAVEQYGQPVKIIKSNFDEDNDNKPQMSRQVIIIHRDNSSTLKSQKEKSFTNIDRFDIEVTVKDLRSDDPIQNLVDVIKKSLIGSIFGGVPIQVLTATSEGVANGIWKYIITVTVITNQSAEIDPDDECTLGDITDFDFVISLAPSYNIPLGGN